MGTILFRKNAPAGSGDRDKDYRLRPDQYPECINDYGVMGMSAGPKEWTQTQVKQEESGDGSVYTYYKVKVALHLTHGRVDAR